MTIARFVHVSPEQYTRDQGNAASSLPLDAIPLPRRATTGSAGYDLVCPTEVLLQPGESATIATGLRCLMDAGWVLLLFPRSSLGFRHQMCLSNTVGVIDSDYSLAANEGHILVKVHNGGDHALCIHAGERFCQGIFLPYGLAEEAEVSAARDGGIGSTGR